MFQQLNYVSFDNTECQILGTSYKDKIYNLKNQLEIKSLKNWCDIAWKYEDDVSAIHLDSNWLIRFGFKEINKVSKTFKRYVDEKTKRCFYAELEVVGNNPIWSVSYVNAPDDEVTKTLRHVHSLQNFYYAMSDELLCLI